jgi:hypothetical protein
VTDELERDMANMKQGDHRKNVRGKQDLQVELVKDGLDLEIQGTTVDLSHDGAFIKTTAWHSLQVKDRATVTFLLPSNVPGKDKTICLHGEAVIDRVDEENEGVGVQFSKGLKLVQQPRIPDAAGKLRYKRIAYYLSTFADVPSIDFIAKYPGGFFVERTQLFFDKSVIIQFITNVVDDEYALKHMKQGAGQLEALKARVIEIRKRKSFGGSDTITIGRSPDNDIVLYNKNVSKSHACLYLTPSREYCYLLDVGSVNGTFLNRSKVASQIEYQLADGDEISFGPETKLIYFSPKAFHAFLSELKST